MPKCFKYLNSNFIQFQDGDTSTDGSSSPELIFSKDGPTLLNVNAPAFTSARYLIISFKLFLISGERKISCVCVCVCACACACACVCVCVCVCVNRLSGCVTGCLGVVTGCLGV